MTKGSDKSWSMRRESTVDKYTLMDAWVKLSTKSEAKRMKVSSSAKGREGAIAIKATIPAAKVNIARLSREINTPGGRRESLAEQELTPLGQDV